jgi:hypothetical protein
MFRIRDAYPGSEFFHPGSRIQGQKDSGSRIRIHIKEFNYFNPTIDSKLSETKSGLFIPDPDPDFLPFLDPGSRGQKGTGYRIWIRNTAF